MIYTDTRDAVFNELYAIAMNDDKVIVLTADTGARKFNDFKLNIPKQFYNVGISEANMMSVAGGLALGGKHVFVFGISNFVTLRCYEQIKLDICAMRLPVTILGMGTGYSYSSDGATHHITEDVSIMRALPNMTIWSPSDYTMSAELIRRAYELNAPSYLRFDKGPFVNYHNADDVEFRYGMRILRHGDDVMIIANGIMVQEAIKISDEFKGIGINVGVVDIYCLKPILHTLLTHITNTAKCILTLEEHSIIGGLGSAVSEILIDKPVSIMGIPDIMHFEAGSREFMRSLDGIDNHSISKSIMHLAEKYK